MRGVKGIKGDHREVFIASAIPQDGLNPRLPQRTEHNLDRLFKTMLMSRKSRNRGGEELPTTMSATTRRALIAPSHRSSRARPALSS